jgi:hypothetical protein
MKNTYNIDDLTKLLNRSRSSIERYRKKGLIPNPDLITGYPQWSRQLVETFAPNLTTNP